jgi:competence ComEA-like helix-hairpin-helix protein
MKRIVLTSLAVAVCVVGVAAAVMSAASPDPRARQDLPEGQGKETTLRLCTGSCHGIDKFMSEHRSKSQWLETIETMKTDGAKGPDEDFTAAVAYLTIHMGVPVRINKATARQIDDVLILDAGLADAIVKYRDEHGPFATWDDFVKVPGLDPKKLEEQKPNVMF